MKSIKYSPILRAIKSLRKPKLDLSRFDSLIGKDTTISDAHMTLTKSVRIEGNLNYCLFKEVRDPKHMTIVVMRRGSSVSSIEGMSVDVLIVDGAELRVASGEKLIVREKLVIKNEGRVEANLVYNEISVDACSALSGTIEKVGQVEEGYGPRVEATNVSTLKAA